MFISLYSGYSYPLTPDIHTLLPRICIPSYPGYAYSLTLDINMYPLTRIFIPDIINNTLVINTLVSRIFIPS